MKYLRVHLALTILVLASLACATLTNGGGSAPVATAPGDSNPPSNPTQDSGNSNNGDGTSDSGFPLTADAFNITEIGDGSVLFYTKLSLEDTMNFYRDKYAAMGYTERELLTVVEADSGVFSMVFDGDSSGKAVVIQSVDMHDGSRTVAIRLEKV
jgi:hypothetical protein